MNLGNLKIQIIIVAALFITLLSCEKSEITEAPNIILIFMDDMGYGDLECYGHPLIKTPNLNRLADDGIRFNSFYAAASVCTPSRAGLLTGRYPVRNAPNNFGPESVTGLPLSEVTIANVLKEAGYRTAAIGKWHLGHLPKYLPTKRGFDSFYGLPYSNDMILPWCPWLSEKDKLYLYKDSMPLVEIGKKQDDITVDYMEKAITFIKENKNDQFFLYLAHSMPHLPISTSERFQGTSEAGLYGDVIETVDWTIGEIMNTLERQGLKDNTLVIFTSDNGPWHNLPDRMLQDGIVSWHTGSVGILRGAKNTSYEGGFRVPAIMHWPKKIPSGQTNREIATTLDIFTTLVEIAGAQLPQKYEIDGQSLFSVIKGEGPSPRASFYYGRGKNIEAIRQNEWKLRSTETDGIELYNLHEDPGEMYNRKGEQKALVDELMLSMKEFSIQTESNYFNPN